MRRLLTILLALVLLPHASARADDYGPHKDLRDVTYAAKRLLTQRLREQKIDPFTVTISDVVVVKNQAVLSWHSGSQTTMMGLVRYANRWWDAFDGRREQPYRCDWQISNFPLKPTNVWDNVFSLERAGFSPELIAAANAHNAQAQVKQAPAVKPGVTCDYYNAFGAQALKPDGGFVENNPDTNGYHGKLTYGRNNAQTAKLELRARAPSPAEILDYPSPPKGAGGSTGVLFLYFDLDSKAPVSFDKGGNFQVWVPWVMDDSLRYEFELYEGPTVVGPIKASIFDNVLHFDLPAFSLSPGETLGEIDGYW